ncbi:hypothetical protein MHYP_G00184800 [Metynnis hypsauchen]
MAGCHWVLASEAAAHSLMLGLEEAGGGGGLAGGWRCEKDDWLYSRRPLGNRACPCVNELTAWPPLKGPRLNRPKPPSLPPSFVLTGWGGCSPLHPFAPPCVISCYSSALSAPVSILHRAGKFLPC